MRVIVAIALLTTAINLIPIYFPHGIFEMSPAEDALLNLVNSEDYIRLIEFSLVIVVPMLIDALSYPLHHDTYFLAERIVLIIACPIPCCLLYWVRGSVSTGIALGCLFAIQCIWISGSLVNALLQAKHFAVRYLWVQATFALFCVGHLIPLFALPASAGFGFMVFCNIAYVAAYLLLSFGLVEYAAKLWSHYAEKHFVRHTEFLPLFCLVMLWCYHSTYFIAYIYWKLPALDSNDINLECLTYLIVISSLVCSICTILPGKIARTHATEVQHDLEMKKSFVRYIGHEIRTPLNVASIGLDLLSTSLSLNRPIVDIDNSPSEWNFQRHKDHGSIRENSLVQPTTNLIPVTTVMSHSSVGKTDIDDNMSDDVNHILDEVRKAIVLGTGVLNDLLLYDRLDSSKLALDKCMINVADLVSSAIDIFVFQAAAMNITFTVELGDDLPRLFGDEHKLRHVVSNLASNAVKFTRSGGAIVVSLRRCSKSDNNEASTDCILFQCRDNGIGIAKENLPKVFKSIIQFDANVNQAGKGTGLGLFITKGLVESHGGSVAVHSDGLGTGCTFSVILPLDSSFKRKQNSGLVGFKLIRQYLYGAFRMCLRTPVLYGDAKVGPVIVEHVAHDESFDRMEAGTANRLDNDADNKMDDAFAISAKSNAGADHSDRDDKSVTKVSTRREKRETMSLTDLRTQKWLTGHCALIVDDSVSNIKMLKLLLNRIGCSCVSATDGVHAVTAMKEYMNSLAESSKGSSHDSSNAVSNFDEGRTASSRRIPKKIDFVLMDNYMPNMTGTDACKEIRLLGYRGPILGLTGHALNDDVTAFKEAGANHVLSKPLDLASLYADLKELLALSYVR
jgi:signal transduction histidine kinase/ActR/RegA family two-component response regulator